MLRLVRNRRIWSYTRFARLLLPLVNPFLFSFFTSLQGSIPHAAEMSKQDDEKVNFALEIINSSRIFKVPT